MYLLLLTGGFSVKQTVISMYMLSGAFTCPAAAVSFQGFPTPVLALWDDCDWCLDEMKAHKYADNSFSFSWALDEFFCAEKNWLIFLTCGFFKGNNSTYLSKPIHSLSCQALNTLPSMKMFVSSMREEGGREMLETEIRGLY